MVVPKLGLIISPFSSKMEIKCYNKFPFKMRSYVIKYDIKYVIKCYKSIMTLAWFQFPTDILVQA